MRGRNYHHSLDYLFLFTLGLFGIYFINGRVIDHPSGKLHLSTAAFQTFFARILQQNASMQACPAPKFPLERNDCTLPTCRQDKDCPSKNQSCCFNGCIFACAERISPAPVIDWEEEPPSSPAIYSEESPAVLRCSAIPRPAPSEPVVCPKGYVCRIDHYMEPVEGLPNIGVCVPESPEYFGTQPEEESIINEKTGTRETDEQNDETYIRRVKYFPPERYSIYLQGGCILSENQYWSMQSMKKREHVEDCFCNDGNVVCKLKRKY